MDRTDEDRAEPLTDEELAAMDRAYAPSEDWRWVHGHAGLQRPLIRRLVADLRASRAEVERLRAWHDQFSDAIEAYRAGWPNPVAAIPATNAINALVNAYDESRLD